MPQGPAAAAADGYPHSGCVAAPSSNRKQAEGQCRGKQRHAPRPRNYSWAELMRRVFAFDVLECDRCGGRMRIIAALHPPEAIRKILDCLGLPVRAPPITPALRGLDGDEQVVF